MTFLFFDCIQLKNNNWRFGDLEPKFLLKPERKIVKEILSLCFCLFNAITNVFCFLVGIMTLLFLLE